MKLRQIEAFKAVMESGSMTAASQKLFLTQPAVSKLIAQLENAIDMPLFIREHGRLKPTSEADMLYIQVAQTFALLANLSTVAKEIKTMKRGRLLVGAIPMLCNSWLPRQCVLFGEAKGAVSLTLETRSSMKVLELVANGQVDVGLGMMADDPRVNSELFAEIEALCILSPGHPLAGKEVITPTDFHGHRFVHTGGLDGTRGKIEAMFSTFDVEVDAKFETIAGSTTCNFIAAGAGMSLVNALSALEFRHTGYEIRRFEPRLWFKVYLLSPRHRPVSMLADAFREQLKASAAVDLLDIAGRCLDEQASESAARGRDAPAA